MAVRGSKLAFGAVLLGVTALLDASVGAHAVAASRLCRQLEAELVGASSGGRASPAQARKYDSAIARQGEELAKARGRANRAGCGFSIFSSNVGTCASLNASIARMTANLDTLRRDRAKFAKGAKARKRGTILAALDANDCRKARSAVRQIPEKKTPSQWLSDESYQETARKPATAEPVEEDDYTYLSPLITITTAAAPRPSGNFRTMCVRTCDGYFFPMSNAASLREFERDQKNCESSCPGTEMQVFYQKGLGADSANMTSSVTGRPYRELPTAYLYKKPSNEDAPACGCNTAQGYEIIGSGSVATSGPVQQSPSITSFAAAPEPRKGNADIAAEPKGDAEKQKPVAPHEGEAERKVRVVAPAFFPDP